MRSVLQPVKYLTIGSTTYTLLYSFDDIADAEETTGRALITGIQRRDLRAPAINLVRALLYALTRQNHADLDYNHIKALVTPKTIGHIWATVLDVWVAGTFERDKDAEESDPTTDQS